MVDRDDLAVFGEWFDLQGEVVCRAGEPVTEQQRRAATVARAPAVPRHVHIVDGERAGQVGDHVPTVADCYPGRANCDCSRGAEKGTCLPAGGWSGLLKLAASKDSIDASGNPIVISGNHNNTVAEAVYPRGRILAYVMPN